MTYGAVCLGVSLLIGVAILQFAWREPRFALLSLVVVGGLIPLTLWWGWPRWVIAVMAVASVAATFSEVRFQLSYGGIISIATVVQLALELAGCIFLFLPSSRRWYHRSRVLPEES